MTAAASNDDVQTLVTSALRDTMPDEIYMIGDEQTDYIVKMAVLGKEFDEAFDTRGRGAESPSVETIQMVLLGAQIVLVLVEIWQKAKSASNPKRAFEDEAAEGRKAMNLPKEMAPLWSKLLTKVYDLLSKATQSK